MNEPTQEQIKEFWEWCGFRHFVETKYGRAVDMWEYPKPYGVKRNRSYLPLIDLNNLFKYAVPRFKEMCASRPDYEGIDTCDNDIHIFLRLCEGKGWTKSGWMCSIQGFRELADVEGGETSALALFWALDKVREEK